MTSEQAGAITLLILGGDDAGKAIPVEGELSVGRAEGVDLILDDPETSRRHAVFRRDGDMLEVEDLGSLNGTWVNGNRISAPVQLAPEDVVKVGATQLRVVSPPAVA